MKKNVPTLLEINQIIHWTYLKCESVQKALQFVPMMCHQYIQYIFGSEFPLCFQERQVENKVASIFVQLTSQIFPEEAQILLSLFISFTKLQVNVCKNVRLLSQ